MSIVATAPRLAPTLLWSGILLIGSFGSVVFEEVSRCVEDELRRGESWRMCTRTRAGWEGASGNMRLDINLRVRY